MLFFANFLIPIVMLSGLVGVFLLPGWLLGRRIGSESVVLTSFFGSCAICFNAMLLLDALRIPFTLFNLTLVLSVCSVLLHRWAGHRTAPDIAPAPSDRCTWQPHGWQWLWIVPVGAAFLSLATRAILDPLSGWDNNFRWDYLARLMLAQGSLAHYPAVTSEDFLLYGWCDGIPPLVSMLNFLLYLAGGSAQPAFTAVRIIAEALLLGVSCFRLAQHWGGQRAGWPALATLATSSLLLWSVANGQETGLLALSLTSLVLLLEKHRTSPTTGGPLWIGIVAGVGALSRDYGLALIVFGGSALVLQRSPRKDLSAFALAALLVAGPWYARNGVITDNPLFPHSFGGLLPSNPVHAETMRGIASDWALSAGNVSLSQIPKVIGATAGWSLVAGLCGVLLAGRRAWLGASAIGLIIGLWAWALPLTAGGWSYAHRVLGPAVVIGAALAGRAIASKPRLQPVIYSLTLLLAVDAARRSWLLPTQPLAPPLPYTWTRWEYDRSIVTQLRKTGIWKILIAESRGEGILVDHPAAQVEIRALGGRALPWFSPQVRPLFDPARSFSDVRGELRARHVRFITLSEDNAGWAYFQSKFPALRELTTNYAPTVNHGKFKIYDLNFLAPFNTSSVAP